LRNLSILVRLRRLGTNGVLRRLVGLLPDDRVRSVTSFTENHERLRDSEALQKLLTKPLDHRRV